MTMWRVLLILLLFTGWARAQFNDLNDPGFVAGLTSAAGGPGGVSAGLVLWLKPESLSGNNGDTVIKWSDSSGNNYHATNTSANGVILTNNILNGYSGVWLGANTSQGLIVSNPPAVLAFSGKDGLTSFTVVKRNAFGSQDGYYFCIGSATYSAVPTFCIANRILDGIQKVYADRGNSAGTVNNTATWISGFAIYVYTAQWTNTTGTMVSKTETNTFTLPGTSGQTTTNSCVTLSIGEFNNAGPKSLNGWVVEQIAYNVPLSTSDRVLVFNYLKTKYGL